MQILGKSAISLELTYVFENSVEDAKSLVLKVRTHLFIHTHTLLHPALKSIQWVRERPSASLPPRHSRQRCQVSDWQPLVFLHTLKLSEPVFLPHWNPFHHLLNILIFSHAHTHPTLHGVSACRLSFSLFLYWSLCPHSWCQSRFLQVHFKGIEPLVFHSQENNTESLLCACSVDSLSWFNLTASQKF